MIDLKNYTGITLIDYSGEDCMEAEISPLHWHVMDNLDNW